MWMLRCYYGSHVVHGHVVDFIVVLAFALKRIERGLHLL